jgi:hypothetical protein
MIKDLIWINPAQMLLLTNRIDGSTVYHITEFHHTNSQIEISAF